MPAATATSRVAPKTTGDDIVAPFPPVMSLLALFSVIALAPEIVPATVRSPVIVIP